MKKAYAPETRDIPLTFLDCAKYCRNICMIGDKNLCTCEDRRDDPYHFIGNGCPAGFSP